MRPLRTFSIPKNPVALTQATGITHSDPFQFASPVGTTVLMGYAGLPIVFPAAPADSRIEAKGELEAEFSVPVSAHPQRGLLPMISVGTVAYLQETALIPQAFHASLQLYDDLTNTWLTEFPFPGERSYSAIRLMYFITSWYPLEEPEPVVGVLAAHYTLVEGVVQHLSV